MCYTYFFFKITDFKILSYVFLEKIAEKRHLTTENCEIQIFRSHVLWDRSTT